MRYIAKILLLLTSRFFQAKLAYQLVYHKNSGTLPLKEHCRLNLAVLDFWFQKIRHLSKFITGIFILRKRGIISSKICVQV